jgi:hypothetical protein
VFINTDKGLLAISRITSVRRRVGDEGGSIVYFENGQGQVEDVTTWIDLEGITAAAAQVIPAQPGYFALEDYRDGEPPHRTAIIAWRVMPDATWPVCAGSISNDAMILCPDGQVVSTDGEAWRDEEAFIDEMKAARAVREG